MEMFTTNLFVFNSFRLPERIFRVFLRSIDRKMQKVLSGQSISVDMASCKVAELHKTSGLKITKTTLPDERLDFNRTFQQIRFGLDDFYRERNLVFNNLAFHEEGEALSVLNQAEERLNKTAPKLNELLEIYHKEEESVRNVNISPLWIAKTTMPEGRRDFNETFFHIRNEIEKFYKEQNPVFNNTISPELWLKQEAKAERQENPVKESDSDKPVKSGRSEEGDSGISETPFSCAEGAEVIFSMAGSLKAEAFVYQYSERVNSDQDQPMDPKDAGIGGSPYFQCSLTAIENFTEYPAVTDQVSKPVSPPLAEDKGPEERICSSHLIMLGKKKRKIHRPVRMLWNFQDRKERRQEKIPEAEPGRHGEEESTRNILNESLAHTG